MRINNNCGTRSLSQNQANRTSCTWGGANEWVRSIKNVCSLDSGSWILVNNDGRGISMEKTIKIKN